MNNDHDNTSGLATAPTRTTSRRRRGGWWTARAPSPATSGCTATAAVRTTSITTSRWKCTAACRSRTRTATTSRRWRRQARERWRQWDACWWPRSCCLLRRHAGAGGRRRQEPAGGVPDAPRSASMSSSRGSAGRWRPRPASAACRRPPSGSKCGIRRAAVVWDSKRTDGSGAVHVTYGGAPLKAATRYAWTVTVWTQAGAPLTASSWFETGLMDPSPSSAAWGGATWIGGGNDDLVLYSPYLAIFDVRYVIAIAQGSTRASFVYGANDSRLMDRFKNIYQVESAQGPELHQAGARHLGARRAAGRQGEAPRLPRRLQGHRQPVAAAQDVRHRRRGRSTTRTSTPSTRSSSAARSARSR